MRRGRHIHTYKTNAEFEEAYKGSYYHEPWVSYTKSDDRVNYNKTEYEKLLETPLTFEIKSNGNIKWKANTTAYTVALEYSKDSGETWTSITSTTGGTTIPVVSGDTVQFRGNNTTMSSGNNNYNFFSGTTCQFAVKGNIMSLLDKNNFSILSTLPSAYTFNYFFSGCTGLIDASKLLLPATTLTENCYGNMFAGCTSLIQAPSILPATTLAVLCYVGMFNGCTSLTTAPELPATTLASRCYMGMFCDCTSLTTAPELPATTLANWCYSTMFAGCLSLNYIKCLATDISASMRTMSWVDDVSSTGTFVKDSSIPVGAGGWTTGVDGIPSNWTVRDA